MEWNNDLSRIDLLIDGKQRNNFDCIKEVIITGCWSLWIHRNKIIFDTQNLDIHECYRIFKETFALVMHRAKPSLKEGMQQWLDSL